MNYQIIITYRNGSLITLDVPENYYQEKYSKKSDEKIHTIFMKEFKNFKNALNRNKDSMIEVGDYLKFSNATISSANILGIDLKSLEATKDIVANMSIPGVHDKTYLDLGDTGLDILIEKLKTTNIIENLDKFVQKVNAMMAKKDVEVTIKAGGKKKSTPTASTTTTKKKVETPIVAEIEDKKEEIQEEGK